jgi:hypothetical protein
MDAKRLADSMEDYVRSENARLTNFLDKESRKRPDYVVLRRIQVLGLTNSLRTALVELEQSQAGVALLEAEIERLKRGSSVLDPIVMREITRTYREMALSTGDDASDTWEEKSG